MPDQPTSTPSTPGTAGTASTSSTAGTIDPPSTASTACTINPAGTASTLNPAGTVSTVDPAGTLNPAGTAGTNPASTASTIEASLLQLTEAHVRQVERDLTGVGEQECLYCYLVRMLEEFGCAGENHQWTRRWIAAQPRPANWVLGWVKRNGGICCDCEVVMNVFRDDRFSQRHRRLRCEASYQARRPGW